MGGDSCSKCCGLESQYGILDGHVFTLICCKFFLLNCNVSFERPKINEIEAPGMTLFKKEH